MSFELLIKPLKAEKKPYILFIFTFLISTIAIFLSYKIFPNSASVLLITFSIIPLIPIMTKLIEIEETRFEKAKKWYDKKNYSIIKIYAFIFIGFVISFSLWYTFLPTDKSKDIFREQIYTLYENDDYKANHATGAAVTPESYEGQVRTCDTTIYQRYMDEYKLSNCIVKDYDKDGHYEYLMISEDGRDYVYLTKEEKLKPYSSFIRNYFFMNNIKILIFVFLTSFIFGAGALFVLTWNASIIGVFIGEIAHRIVITITSPFATVSAYIKALPVSLGALVLHGIPEVIGFFVAALSGGILSVAMIRHNFRDKHFLKILKDSLLLLAISVVFIYIAAFIESF